MQITIEEFARTRTRATDPQTSRDAAASVARGVDAHHVAIRRALAAEPGETRPTRTGRQARVWGVV